MLERLKKSFLLEHYRFDEAKLALIPFLVFALLISAQIFRDFALLHDPVILWIDIVLRLFSSAFILLAFLAVDQKWGKYTYVLLIVGYFILGTFTGLISFTFRPPEKLFEFLPGMMGVAYFYFLLPAPLWLKLFGSFDYSLLFVYRIAANRHYSGDDLFVIGFSLVFLNLMGILSAVTMARLRAKDFEYQKKRENEIHFKKVVGDSSFDSTVIVKDGKIVESNRAFQERFDLDSTRLHGSLLSDFVLIPHKYKVDFENGSKIQGTVYGELGDIPVEMFGRPIVIEGENYLCLTMRDISKDESQISLPTDGLSVRLERLPLTKREREIALRILEGKTRFQISVELYISDETVKKHTTNIYQKLEIRSKIELYNLILAG